MRSERSKKLIRRTSPTGPRKSGFFPHLVKTAPVMAEKPSPFNLDPTTWSQVRQRQHPGTPPRVVTPVPQANSDEKFPVDAPDQELTEREQRVYGHPNFQRAYSAAQHKQVTEERKDRRLGTVRLKILHASINQPQLPIPPQVEKERHEMFQDIAMEVTETGYKKAFQNAVVKYITNLSAEDVERHGDPYFANIKRMLAQQQEAKEAAAANKYWWITFNPHPSVPIEKSFAAWEQYMRLKQNQMHIWSIENHTANGQRVHYHGLVKKSGNQHSSKSKMMTAAFRIFEEYCDVGNSHCFKLKAIDKQADADRIISYIQGDKVDPNKQNNVEMDREWRQLNGFEQVYVSESWAELTDEI